MHHFSTKFHIYGNKVLFNKFNTILCYISNFVITAIMLSIPFIHDQKNFELRFKTIATRCDYIPLNLFLDSLQKVKYAKSPFANSLIYRDLFLQILGFQLFRRGFITSDV